MLDIKKRTTLVRERLLADAIREFVAELRLVDVVDYIAYLRLEMSPTSCRLRPN